MQALLALSLALSSLTAPVPGVPMDVAPPPPLVLPKSPCQTGIALFAPVDLEKYPCIEIIDA